MVDRRDIGGKRQGGRDHLGPWRKPRQPKSHHQGGRAGVHHAGVRRANPLCERRFKLRHPAPEGELITQHCTDSSSGTFHGDQWVTVELEVRGSESLTHRINGEIVFELEDIQLDSTDADAQALIANGSDIILKEGYVAIQAESHPTQFRAIELLPLTKTE